MMIKPRWITLTICIMAVLMISGTAWGDIGKPKQTEKLEIKQPGLFELAHKRAVLAIAPWPNKYGQADKSRRSGVKGPGGIIALEHTIKMTAPLGLTGQEDFVVFTQILVGPGNVLFLKVNRNDTAWASLYAFKEDTGVLWEVGVAQFQDVCLDAIGNAYFITPDLKYLESRTRTGGFRWSYQYSSNGTHELLTVGSRAYVLATVGMYGNKHLIAVNKNGTQAWSVSLDNDIVIEGISADSSGNVYLRARDWQKGLYKYDTNGVLEWQTTLVCPFVQLTGQSLNDMGPICGDDGRVWLNERWAFIADKSYHSTPTYVLNTDGTIYDCGSDVIEKKYTGACYTTDGTLCLATNDAEIIAISNWGTTLWTSQLPWWGNIPHGGQIKALAMDSGNIIYMLYHVNDMRILYILDANTGEGLGVKQVQYPDTPGNYDWLVIGDDEKLALLNSNGYLNVYTETMEDLSIHLEAEPERFRIESIKKFKGDD